MNLNKDTSVVILILVLYRLLGQILLAMHCIMWLHCLLLTTQRLACHFPAGPRIFRLCFVPCLFIQKLYLSAKGEMTMSIVYQSSATLHAY